MNGAKNVGQKGIEKRLVNEKTGDVKITEKWSISDVNKLGVNHVSNVCDNKSDSREVVV